MKHIDDAGYWEMWSSMSDWQKADIARRWKRYGRGKKEWLSEALMSFYTHNYDDYLMECDYDQQEAKNQDLDLWGDY